MQFVLPETLHRGFSGVFCLGFAGEEVGWGRIFSKMLSTPSLTILTREEVSTHSFLTMYVTPPDTSSDI